ncbi:MAG: hypothetical protein R3B70_31885 [Polyangiaceae bacterium]
MGSSVIDAFLRGHVVAWAALFAVVLLATAAALAQKLRRATPARVLLTSVLVSIVSAAGILAGSALSIPRIVWRRGPIPAFAVPSGEGWRALRAPSTAILIEGRPEVGLAGLDAGGRVLLYGLFSGQPLPGYPEAAPTPPAPGGARICRFDRDECRAWPAEWPAPAPASSGSELVWTRDLTAHALAYDTESGLLLHHVEGLRVSDGALAMAGDRGGSPRRGVGPTLTGTWALEQVGKMSNEPSRDGPIALFVVRRLADQRLDAVRVVAFPGEAGSTFAVDRATTSLTAAPAVFKWVSRPLSLLLVMWFPLVSIAFQGAPAWWARARRKKLEAGAPVSEMPVTQTELATRARYAMAETLHGPALFALGLAVLAPALVAIAGMLAAR